jgi:hypothetical protein
VRDFATGLPHLNRCTMMFGSDDSPPLLSRIVVIRTNADSRPALSVEPKLDCKSRRDALIVARHFSGGDEAGKGPSSVGTAESTPHKAGITINIVLLQENQEFFLKTVLLVMFGLRLNISDRVRFL